MVGPIALLLALTASSAAAQVQVDGAIQFGAVHGQGHLGSASILPGLAAGLRVSDRLTFRVRYLNLDFSDFDRTYGNISVNSHQRERRLIAGEILYDFSAERKAGAFVGFSVARRQDRETVTCEPISCEDVNQIRGGIRVAPTGTHVSTYPSLGVLAGIRVRPIERITIHAFLGLHGMVHEDDGTVELGVLVAVSVFRSK